MLIGSGRIRSCHASPDCVAGSLSPDNLEGMETGVRDGLVEMVIMEKPIRSLLASLDDYLMNLSVADALCNPATTEPEEGNNLENDENKVI
ncbi:MULTISPECIES: KEOPS complex subunit Pcc1 [Methanocalculus]|uniref:KEOPS complex subunit Pcc1 n=1 Tax=Methanocalculus TaxID=71151 RepID=UPI0020A02799|nr:MULTISPECIES: KEOPS complex subunit Pcc1 [unclassified Methanocalculus]MCP1662225.1 hypothetical protein [Methanocalculus sp. AMF5]